MNFDRVRDRIKKYENGKVHSTHKVSKKDVNILLGITIGIYELRFFLDNNVGKFWKTLSCSIPVVCLIKV
jgi:hypothetical protein